MGPVFGNINNEQQEASAEGRRPPDSLKGGLTGEKSHLEGTSNRSKSLNPFSEKAEEISLRHLGRGFKRGLIKGWEYSLRFREMRGRDHQRRNPVSI